MRSTIIQARGSLPAITRNDDMLYEGNLVRYFQIVFNLGQNNGNPYHNFRHSSHVFYMCYQACLFYGTMLSPRQMRNLLIAALFHDFNHTGKAGDDWVNIKQAIAGLFLHLETVDIPYSEEIAELISATKFPPEQRPEDLSLSAQILRDADMSQALSAVWIQQTVFGLAEEWGKPPIEVLMMQPLFHEKLAFYTAWVKQEFPKEHIDAKIAEARELIEVLTMDPNSLLPATV